MKQALLNLIGGCIAQIYGLKLGMGFLVTPKIHKKCGST